jgi:hypothetical protein
MALHQLATYSSTFSGLAKIIIFSPLLNFSEKKHNIECQKSKKFNQSD